MDGDEKLFVVCVKVVISRKRWNTSNQRGCVHDNE